jgi:hypothetical protein
MESALPALWLEQLFRLRVSIVVLKLRRICFLNTPCHGPNCIMWCRSGGEMVGGIWNVFRASNEVNSSVFEGER